MPYQMSDRQVVYRRLIFILENRNWVQYAFFEYNIFICISSCGSAAVFCRTEEI